MLDDKAVEIGIWSPKETIFTHTINEPGMQHVPYKLSLNPPVPLDDAMTIAETYILTQGLIL